MYRLTLMLLSSWLAALPAQPLVNVTCVENYGIPSGWLEESLVIPSILRSLKVSLLEIGSDCPELRLNISWSINIDNSNMYLTGTRITVHGLPFDCSYQPALSKANTSGLEEMWFQFTNLAAEPGTTYYVIGYNLPVPPIDGELPQKFAVLKIPDCRTLRKKPYAACAKKGGSLWNPNVTSVHLKDHVNISFTSSMYSEKYRLQLRDEQNEGMIDESWIDTEGLDSRYTGMVNFSGPCENFSACVMLYFEGCSPEYLHCRKVGCLHKEEEKRETVSCVTKLWCVGIILVLLLIFLCIMYQVYLDPPHFRQKILAKEPICVLVIYPAKSSAFQKAVIALAELLQDHCHCRVLLDVWQRAHLGRLGLMGWLSEQLNSANKVLFVVAQQSEPQLSHLRDHTVPASAEDLFSLALTLMANHAQQPVALSKFATVHLGTRLERKSLPPALTLCRAFCLMQDLGSLCSYLHNRLSYFASIRLALPSSMATKKLREAIEALK